MTETVSPTAKGRQSAAPTRIVQVWDPLVRLIHWSVVGAVLLNASVIEEESAAHELIGYVAVALVGLRLVWGLVGTEPARFSAFPPNPVAAIRHLAGLLRGEDRVHLSHNPAGALMAYNLWATVLAMGVTGWMMGTVRFFGMDWVKELHEALFGWLMISVALHLIGVLADSRLTRVNLVRAMLDGKKRIARRSDRQ